MRITLSAFGNLRNYMPQRRERLSLEVDGSMTVETLFGQLGIPIQEVGLVAVNGGKVGEDSPLADGDDVQAFSPIGGGSNEVTEGGLFRR